nr:hypothetical protein [Terrimicrobiaceae bacterium]
GRPRKLHLEESLVSADFTDFEPTVNHIKSGMLAECPYFKVEKETFSDPIPALSAPRFAIYNVLAGGVTCAGITFRPGDFFLVPASLTTATLTPTADNSVILRATLPVR